MKYDQLIRNGTLVDGTGSERYVADIAIKDGRIAVIGQVSPGDAGEVIDADGLVVSPGFVDCHTHYDAQLFWDPLASPSSFHGVTTVIGGLCGFTIQPLDEQTAEYIVPMLSKVEDIPISALDAGVPFDWYSFAEYRSRLEGRLAINAGFATGHSALRQLVMKERAKGERATPADLKQMQAYLRQSLADGALGFSTSYSTTHNDHLGEPVPSRHADYEEFVALASVCRDFEGSQVEIQPGMEFDEEAAQLMAGMSVASQRTVNWNAMFTKGMDDETLRLIERQLSMSDYARERGGNVVGLTVPVHGSAHIDMMRGCGVFDAIPGWEEFFRLSVADRVGALRNSEWREKLKESALSSEAQALAHVRVITNGDRLLVEAAATSEVRRYEGASLREIADQQGKVPLDVLFDLGVADNLGTLFTFRPIGDDAETYRKRLALWRDDRLCVGGSDAGAHVETIDTFNYFTRLLARPVRELGVVSLEECIHHITQAPARLMGLRDRGELRVGAWADLCVFDKDTVGTRAVETRNDFPGGASRLYAEADGMERVIVSGVTVLDRGRPTGKLPGQFLARGQDTYTVGVDVWR